MRAAKTIHYCGIVLISLAVMCGCAVVKTPATTRVALLAPFEGRYREIGYNALYAARLAFADTPNTSLEFLAVDDGGTPERAAERAHALALDPQVVAAVALGYHAAAPETLAAFGDIPVLIVGEWTNSPPSAIVFVFSNPDISARITVPPLFDVTQAVALETPVVGGEVFALRNFTRMRDDSADITIASSGSLPNPQFTERYRQSDPFAPLPGLLATLTYDAFHMILLADHTNRTNLNTTLQNRTYEGLNGSIQFVDGYWENAPVHFYRYENGQLTTADDIVE
jgi:ABC-type branched-subunit amino acid transport system substrate-binding protein